LALLAGIISFVLAPLAGDALFAKLWGVEPLSYIGAILVMTGLGLATLSYVIPSLVLRRTAGSVTDAETPQLWSELTQQYFELFDHDLGRPMRRVLGKERELRFRIQSSGTGIDPVIQELLDEIERQTTNFRLMMSNIQVLVQLEAPGGPARPQPVEPSQVIRNIIDRYASSGSDPHKEITWWAEPPEFGIVYSDSSAIEHIVTNLLDNAARFATTHVEVKLTKNPTHFFIRVWDDGPGIASHYLQHIFDRSWTPEVARREEKTSSGLGLYIARTLAIRCRGELAVESVAAPDPNHHTEFLLSLPSAQAEVTLP